MLISTLKAERLTVQIGVILGLDSLLSRLNWYLMKLNSTTNIIFNRLHIKN